MEDQGLPGLRAQYEFVPAGEAVELRLGLRFDPAETELTQAVRDVWLELRDRLFGGTGGTLPSVPVSLVTSLALDPLTLTADGVALRDQFASFVAEVGALPDKVEAAVEAELTFGLAKAAAKTLPGDFGPIEVRLDYGEGGSVTASPKLNGDLGVYPFTAAFEDCWQGFDGGEGRLALFVQRSEPAVFCYVRTGKGSGISLANPKSPEFTYHAVPPLAAVPLMGLVETTDGAAERVEAVDLDGWWALFAETLERLVAVATGDTRDRLVGLRRGLAGAMADRLQSFATASTGDGLKAVRAVFEAALEDDLRSRPTVVGAAVEVGRGGIPSDEPATILSGTAAAPIGIFTGTASFTAVHLKPGTQWLAYAAPPASAGFARQSFPMRFAGDRLESEGATPLDLILHASAETDDLSVDFGLQSAPVPLIGLPAAPAFSASAARASDPPETLGEALAWDVEVVMSAMPAGQDRFAFAIAFDEEAAPASPSSPASSEAFFGALGRAVRFSAGLAAEPGSDSADLFVELAEAVAETLPGWRAPVLDVPTLPGQWRYEFDLGEPPTLVVTREASGTAEPPPWPAVAGYGLPDDAGAIARYQPEAGGEEEAGLQIIVPGFRLLTDRAVRVHGRFIRNRGLAGLAFVYHGAIASSRTLSPSLEWEASQPEPPAASLAAALRALLAVIGEYSKRPYALGLDAGLVQWLEAAGEASLGTRIPLALMPRVAVGGAEGTAVADLAREVAQALASARAGMGPAAAKEEVALTLTLFDEAPTPLARLMVRIPVPDGEAWWQADPA